MGAASHLAQSYFGIWQVVSIVKVDVVASLHSHVHECDSNTDKVSLYF